MSSGIEVPFFGATDFKPRLENRRSREVGPRLEASASMTCGTAALGALRRPRWKTKALRRYQTSGNVGQLLQQRGNVRRRAVSMLQLGPTGSSRLSKRDSSVRRPTPALTGAGKPVRSAEGTNIGHENACWRPGTQLGWGTTEGRTLAAILMVFTYVALRAVEEGS